MQTFVAMEIEAEAAGLMQKPVLKKKKLLSFPWLQVLQMTLNLKVEDISEIAEKI